MMFFGDGSPGIALVGLIVFGAGLTFALKVALPAWRLAKRGD
jgi:hypothetical protein